MGNIKYNEVQIKELKTHKYVKNCTGKHIVFTKECKLEAVKLSKEYILPKEIFSKFGFPEYVINSRVPSLSIDRWKRNVKLKGVIEEKKGKKHKENFDVFQMNKDEELEYLRHKVALLEELKSLTSGEYP